MKKLLMMSAAVLICTTAANAQKSIYTGGPKGAYYNTFCPPLVPALNGSMFMGYACQTSGGTLDNIKQVVAKPSNIGFVQLDVMALQAKENPDLLKQVSIIRQDIACEGLWMVTKNDKLNNYGDVLGYARRIPFVVADGGSAASFAFMQSIDPDGLGRARNIKNVTDATAVINTVSASSDNSVGFFVQFADPDNGNIRLMQEKGLKIIPVVSREIANTKVGDQEVYSIQSFNLKAAGFFASGDDKVTACTPVAIITGNPEGQKDINARDDQKDMIKAVRDVPSTALLPKDDRIASLIKATKKFGGAALNEMLAAADKAKKAAEQMAN